MLGIYHTTEEAEKTQPGSSSKKNRPDIDVRWMVAEAKPGQRTSRAMWEESEGALLFILISLKHFLYWQTLNVPKPSPRAFPQGGVPAMSPSYLGFSRQSNLSARCCVGIPQVWVLPTQDSQTAPEKEWKTPESLLCVVALQSTVQLVCCEAPSASCSCL